ncbi:MAG TPA: hypothetical protein VKR53_09070 [Puia sp.]|nr:hypothetical protein [Puia sp.]
MNVEIQLKLNRFKPKPYQLGLFAAVENEGYKKVLAIWPRRSAKSLCAWNLMIRQAVKQVGVYFYCLPTFRQAKLVIYQGITNDGTTFLDYIPQELIVSKNDTEMKIKLINGSIIQLIGSDTYDTSLVGTNPRMIIFDEMALSDPRAYQFVRPILNANDGIVIILSTPRGRNFLWEIYNIAKDSPDWYCSKLTLDDTQHISMHDIQKEIASGELSECLSLQEYFTSFEQGIEGSYYARYLDKMRIENRISAVPWEPAYQVNCSFDLGVRDSTTILWFQVIGQTIRIIDEYSNQKMGLEHYVGIIKGKPYTYNKFFFPHDIKVMELGSGLTRIDKLKQLGIKATLVDNIPVLDGIECVRSTLPKIWIDEKCKKIILALEKYRQEWDDKRKVYKNQPLHDHHSDWADNIRYLCLSLPKTKDGLTAADIERNYNEAMYGNRIRQGFFNEDNQYNNHW